MIRVLIAEDSRTVAGLLKDVLEAEGHMQVLAVAKNGEEAVALTAELKPDIVTMDIHMPVMDGLEATKAIMAATPTPIVIVSASDRALETGRSFDALRAGALAVVEKPENPMAPRFEILVSELVSAVRTMAGLRVVGHRRTAVPRAPRQDRPPAELVVAAASTGGPAALQRILQTLPANFPVPMLVVQHISTGFVHGLAAWLGGNARLRVRVAEDGDRMASRTVYLAPDDRHLLVAAGGRLALDAGPPMHGLRPSADRLFASAAEHYGNRAVGLVLTGMGTDGGDGARALRAAGAPVAVQNHETAVVWGMPGTVVEAQCATAVLPLDDVAGWLVHTVGKESHVDARSDR